MEFITTSAGQTQKIAFELIKKLAVKKTRSALVLGLAGELGAGKTTFIQGLARALKIKERVLSPTFVIMKKYEVRSMKYEGKNRKEGKKATSDPSLLTSNFFHIDCYRIEKPQEMDTLGFKEILKDPENLVVIEWAEKIKKILPADTIWLKFQHLGEDRRKIILNFKSILN